MQFVSLARFQTEKGMHVNTIIKRLNLLRKSKMIHSLISAVQTLITSSKLHMQCIWDIQNRVATKFASSEIWKQTWGPPMWPTSEEFYRSIKFSISLETFFPQRATIVAEYYFSYRWLSKPHSTVKSKILPPTTHVSKYYHTPVCLLMFPTLIYCCCASSIL